MNYERLKKIVKDRGLTIEEMCKHIDVPLSTFNMNIKNDTLRMRDYEKICQLLKLSPCDLFNTDQNTPIPNPVNYIAEPVTGYDQTMHTLLTNLKAENEGLKNQLKAYETTINTQQKLIDALEGKK